jgi:ABC-2 type transport system permease protein
MVGIIVFFLTFLIAGINFLAERTSGTLEKLLSTPIRRGEIIAGYTFGFGILAVLQSLLVTLYVVYVLGMQVVGSIWFVILINLLTAVTALTLGILLSTLANSEFQMIQFIPIVILPQIFLCGLFDLSGGWEIVGYFMPLYYTTDALSEVMLRGHGIASIYPDLLVLSGLSLVFVLVNTMMLKRHRGV